MRNNNAELQWEDMRGHLTHVNFNTIDVIDVGIFISEYVFVEYLVVLVPCNTIEMVSLPIISETGDRAGHIIKCIPQLFAELVKTPETPVLCGQFSNIPYYDILNV